LGGSGIDLIADVSGEVALDSVSARFEGVDERGTTAVEALGGFRYRFTRSAWVAELAAGRGLNSDLEAPAFRGSLSLAYSPRVGVSTRPDGDRDGDGIADAKDECPEEPGNSGNDGCPEEAAEEVESVAGPPDADGDEVPDVEDECPEEAEDGDGVRDDDGCPERNKGDVTLGEARERVERERIEFEYDSARLKPTSHDTLRNIAGLVKFFSALGTIRIEGHTDRIGPRAHNRDLSRGRAESVRDFLVEQGVSPDRLEVRGYGESQSITDNDTEAGRQDNRRVELVIVAE